MYSEEKRRSPRCTFEQIINISNNRETYIQADGINISEFGIMCGTKEKCDPYDRLFLMFTINNGDTERTIQCDGMVIHSNKKDDSFETGIQFEDLTSEDKAFIASYLKCL